MEAIAADMQLAPEQVEFEGRGYVHSDDVVNAGFVQGETSHVVVQIVYDEIAELDDYDGVEITPLTRELAPENAFALNLMRITVDGKPLDDKGRSSADVQRCTDVALQGADIQFGFDNLEADRRLAVAAEPATVAFYRDGDGWAAEPVRFTMYANYSHFIERAEVRIFAPEQSLEAEPLGARRVRSRRLRRVVAGARDVRDAGARAEVRAARVRQRRHVRRDGAAAAVDRLSRDRRRCRAGAGQAAAGGARR